MIAFVRGRVQSRGSGWVELDVDGIGFHLTLSARAAQGLPAPGEEVSIVTEFLVREDGVVLFGFADAGEREAFRSLLSVATVGPKTALAVLSAFTLPALVSAVRREDVTALSCVPGVGKKTAQRICLELRDRMEQTMEPSSVGDGVTGEALAALISLGYSTAEASEAMAGLDGTAEGAAELVRAALRRLNGQSGRG
jgi:Holliday junction DNA helicase RuvA